MAWVKVGIKDEVGYYVPTFSKAKFRYLKDVSLDDLNDPDKDFKILNPEYALEYLPLDGTLEFLPKGVYKLHCPDRYSDFKIVPWDGPGNQLKLFELGIVKDIIEDFESFNTEEGRAPYNLLGCTHKRGVLLYGPPGTGKTTCLNMIIDSLKDQDVIIFYVDGGLPHDFLQAIKPDNRLKVFIFEEITETVNQTGLGAMLTFLDGENSLNHCYSIATTNYPERLPGNIVNRTGRFDELFKLDAISNKDRKTYLEHFMKREITEEELSYTSDYSMAFLKELLLIVLKNKLSFKEAVDKLDKHKKVVKSSFKREVKELGFRDDDD